MPVVWKDGRSDCRTYGHVITKMSWVDELPNFLGMGLRVRVEPRFHDNHRNDDNDDDNSIDHNDYDILP